MKKKTTILVTTDFSTNSKAGIRFALQLAAQTGYKLVFYHVIDAVAPTLWSQEQAARFTESELKRGKEALGKFLKTLYTQAKVAVSDYDYAVEMGLNVDNFIVNYAQKINADYICMATRGAGVLKKLIGTNASTLVSTSPIPVIVVPHNYRTKSLTKIGYSSDFAHLDQELAVVKDFAAPLKAKVDVYHYHYSLHEPHSKVELKSIIDKHQSKNVAFHIPPLFIEYSLVENLMKTIKKEKPSLMVMFTEQKENWFNRFFFESKTADMTFDINIPLLAIKK